MAETELEEMMDGGYGRHVGSKETSRMSCSIVDGEDRRSGPWPLVAEGSVVTGPGGGLPGICLQPRARRCCSAEVEGSGPSQQGLTAPR